MSSDASSHQDPNRRSPAEFATTRWTQVLEAGQDNPEQARHALGELCQLYWYPLYAFVRRRGANESDAADLTQSFFAEFLRRELVTAADPARGRFRSYLLTAFKAHLSNQRRADKAKKRGGGKIPISIDADEGEARYRQEPFHCQTPEAEYDRRWALTLLERVLDHLEDEYASRDRAEQFQALRGFLTSDPSSASYDEVAQSLNLTVAATKVTVHRLRKRYRELLTREVRETVAGEDDVHNELGELLQSLANDSQK